MRRDGVAGAAGLVRAALGRGLVLGLVWWALVEGEVAYVAQGLPVLVAALAASLWLRPPPARRPTLLGVLAFLPFFLQRSFLGGLDVAWRALRPSLPLRPAFVDYRLRLEDEGPVSLFVNLISLLPGTLSARLDPPRLRVHVLDRDLPVAAELAQLEVKVARVYGLSLPAAAPTVEAVG